MQLNQSNWLPHLRNLPEDVNGYKTCTYLMALEGWRRGLKLTFHIEPGVAVPPSVRFSLSNGEREHFFTVSRGDKVSKEAIKICMVKSLTYKYLAENNVPIPEGKSFTEETNNDEIIDFAKEIGFPLVVKPTDAGSGRGVITNITNIDEFKDALTTVRDRLGFKNVIVERFIVGEDYRIYVVNDKVVGAYKRIPANVIGDGKSTIKELIKKKNKLREKNPFIFDRPIKIDKKLTEFLSEQQLTLESVPKKDERIFLRPQGAYLKERDPVDITDSMPDKIKQIAVKAMKSIPGLTHCDVDMIVNEETGEGYVNEINSRPQISNHLFPIEGEARDIPKEIIDFYFPETINGKRNDQYYYDFNPIYESFRSMSIKKIIIPDIPFDHELTRFRLKGKRLRTRNYEKWVRRQVANLKLNGYIKHLKNGETSIVVGGTSSAIKKFRNIIYNQSAKNTVVTEIKEFDRTAPIKIGFEIINNETDSSDEVEELKEKYKNVSKELELYKTKHEKILNSKSWKMTQVFRNISKIMKSN